MTDDGEVECLVNLVMPENLSIDEQMDVTHDSWQHAGKTKEKEIYKQYNGKGFPANYLQLLEHYSCSTCVMMKGAQDYKHSKRMKEKMKSNGPKRKVKCSIANVTVTDTVTKQIADPRLEDDVLRATTTHMLIDRPTLCPGQKPTGKHTPTGKHNPLGSIMS